MNDIKRISPVVFDSVPVKTKNINNFEVVMEYKDEKIGPYLIDLSHKTRFDLQDSKLESIKILGTKIPVIPGSSALAKQLLINRMNRTQVSIYNLGNEDLDLSNHSGYTDVTECTLFIALIGKNVFSICEKLTALDFMAEDKKTPFLLQGPFSHVPCQIVALSTNKDKAGLVLTCSRGYHRDMIHAILDAGEEFGLNPAGEAKFTDWLKSL